MGYAQELQTRFAAIFTQEQEHPFVRGIGDGSLPLERFRFYIEQDYLFLIEYSRVLALAVAKGQSLAVMEQFAALQHATLHVEMGLHRGYAEKFGIQAADWSAVTIAPTTYAYTRHLLATAYSGSVAAIAVSLLPCQWGYAEIGRKLALAGPPASQPLYGEWIAMYSGEEYQQLVVALLDTFDALAAEVSPGEREELATIFHTSARYEWSFWEMAWRMEQWPV